MEDLRHLRDRIIEAIILDRVLTEIEFPYDVVTGAHREI